MPIPSYAEMIQPLLKALGMNEQGIEVSRAYDLVAEAVGLSDEDRAQMVPSGGQAMYKNRIGWAHDSLKRVGWSSSPRSGVWKITPLGIEELKKHPSGFAIEELKYISRANATVKMSDLLATKPGSIPPTPTPSDEESPDDLIQKALSQIISSVVRDVHERIRQVTPTKFEILVLDLLHALGYGIHRTDLKRVGGSGDGGIDGIVPLDRLGLQKVYVQAKRWQSPVGSPEIQGFVGALQLQGADRGVFITSSEFTKQAIDAAGKAKGTIVLIDGIAMAKLMVEHGVCVEHHQISVPVLRSASFDE
jgi:restriction system protein